MIDFHSHVLPKMDDGSKSGEESVALLEAAFDQGLEGVFATPHFYPKRDDPESFLRRREHSAKSLFAGEADVLKKMPLYLGAEVAYFYGMSRYEKLSELSLGGSDYILIEMPFDRWTSDEVDEILYFRNVSGLTPVLAHFERYLPFGNKKYLRLFLQGDVLLQSNAEFFIGKKSRRKAFSYFKKGYVCLLGSDCHNTETRPENYGEATEIIKGCKKGAMLSSIVESERSIVSRCVPFSL